MTKLSEARPPHFGLTESAAPSTPAAGKFETYAATDGTYHTLDDAGNDRNLTLGGRYVGASATKTANQTNLSDGVATKCTYDTSEFDTDSIFDNGNDRMTVPAGLGGKWLISGAIQVIGLTTETDVQVYLYVDGSALGMFGRHQNTAAFDDRLTFTISRVVSLTAAQYVEVFAVIVGTSTGDLAGAASGPPTYLQASYLGA